MAKRRQTRSRYLSAPPPQTIPSRVVTSVRLPVTLYDECCLIALRSQRSVSATLLEAITCYVQARHCRQAPAR